LADSDYLGWFKPSLPSLFHFIGAVGSG